MAESEPIQLFALKDLPAELNVSRETIKLPPILERQLEDVSFQVGRINVTGDGYCGYYVIQLIDYFMNPNFVRTVQYLEIVRQMVICSANINSDLKTRLINAPPHYLEYIEMGSILGLRVSNLNIAVIVQTKVQKTGEKKQQGYPVRVINYSPGRNWAFLLMTRGAHHYELLTVKEKNLHRVCFTVPEAVEMFKACSGEYPEIPVCAKDQIEFLDPADFHYV